MTSLNGKKLLAAIDWAFPDGDKAKYSGYFHAADFTKAVEITYLNVFDGDKGGVLIEEDVFEVTNRLISLYQDSHYNFKNSLRDFLNKEDPEVRYETGSDPMFILDKGFKASLQSDTKDLRSKFKGYSSLSHKLAAAKAFSEFFFACLESNGTVYKSDKKAVHKSKANKIPRLKTAGKTKLS